MDTISSIHTFLDLQNTHISFQSLQQLACTCLCPSLCIHDVVLQNDLKDLLDGPVGGSGGEIFSDDGMPPHTRIDQIVIHSSDGIDGLMMVTKAGAITTRTPFRGCNKGQRHLFELVPRRAGVACDALGRFRQ